MSVLQVKYPNINVPATRGYCLKYVDDGVSAPKRQPTATVSWNTNPDKHTDALPIGVWLPIFFSIDGGPYKGLGHVAWAFNHDNSWVEIHDSETASGVRPAYRNIQEVFNWFGKNNPMTYLGWSTEVDGCKLANVVADVTPSNSERTAAKGTATVLVDALNVRNSPDKNSASVAVYSMGQKFNYDSYVITNGYVWLSYVAFDGNRRYVAEGPNDGNSNNVWVSGGVS